MWCTCAADHATVECVEVSGSSAGPPGSLSPTCIVGTVSANPKHSAGKASPRGQKRSRDNNKPATTQSRLSFAPVKAANPTKRRAKKGEAGHQEWAAIGFDEVEHLRDKDGRSTRICVQCLLCRMRNITKEYTVLSEGRTDRKVRPSASWSGPNRHMKDVHNLHTAEAITAELGKPWNATKQMVLSGSGQAHPVSWGPRTKEWNKAVTNVARYIATANLPFHIAQTGPFMHFMRKFMPQWPRISKQTITRAVSRQAWEAKSTLAEELREVQQCTRAAMTADMWSSRHGDRYITITAHWVDKNWELQRRMLGECA